MKKHPLFVLALAICLIVAVVLLVLTVLGHSELDAQQQKLNRAVAQDQEARSLDPAPTEANLEASQQNVQSLKAQLERQISIAEGSRKLDLSQTPASRADLQFELEAYKRSFINLAQNITPLKFDQQSGGADQQARGVELPEGFNFGFDTFLGTNTPPEEAHVPLVYQQKEVLSYLLRRLLETQPSKLVAIRREPVQNVIDRRKAAEAAPAQPTTGITLGSSSRNRRSQASAARQRLAADQFTLAQERSLRQPGAVQTLAFELTFQGYTQNLRPFLRSLEAYELPLVVRGVKVRKLDMLPQGGSGQPDQEQYQDDADSQMDAFAAMMGTSSDEVAEATAENTEVAEVAPPNEIRVVQENLSEFTVLVEYIVVTLDPDVATDKPEDAEMAPIAE